MTKKKKTNKNEKMKKEKEIEEVFEDKKEDLKEVETGDKIETKEEPIKKKVSFKKFCEAKIIEDSGKGKLTEEVKIMLKDALYFVNEETENEFLKNLTNERKKEEEEENNKKEKVIETNDTDPIEKTQENKINETESIDTNIVDNEESIIKKEEGTTEKDSKDIVLSETCEEKTEKNKKEKERLSNDILEKRKIKMKNLPKLPAKKLQLSKNNKKSDFLVKIVTPKDIEIEEEEKRSAIEKRNQDTLEQEEKERTLIELRKKRILNIQDEVNFGLYGNLERGKLLETLELRSSIKKKLRSVKQKKGKQKRRVLGKFH